MSESVHKGWDNCVCQGPGFSIHSYSHLNQLRLFHRSTIAHIQHVQSQDMAQISCQVHIHLLRGTFKLDRVIWYPLSQSISPRSSPNVSRPSRKDLNTPPHTQFLLFFYIFWYSL